MHVSSRGFKRVRFLLACSMLAPLFSATVFAGIPAASEIMPKASKSLLLDIESVGGKIIAVGERGHILLSDDQGNTWSQASVPTVQMLNAVDFPDENLGWAVGHDGNILHSEDGGETWLLQRDGLKAQHGSNITALSKAKSKVQDLEKQIEEMSLSVEVEPVEEVVQPLDENGIVIEAPLTIEEQLEEAQWELEKAQESIKGPSIAPPLMDVWFADENNGWAVGAFGTLLQTKNAGKTWIDRGADINNTEGYHLNAVTGVAGTVFIAGEAGFLVYTQDNGETWVKGNLGYEGTIFGILASANGSFVVVTGLRGNTLLSSDMGLTWAPLSPGIDYSLSGGCVYGEESLVLVGSGGSIAVSHDKGATFDRYTLPARASLSSVISLEGDHFLLVGQGGVHQFDINTKKNN